MHETTPNEDYIDSWLDNLQESYRYEKLEKMSVEDLHRMEWELEIDFEEFEATFPSQDNIIKSEEGQKYYYGVENAREPLSTAEKILLRQKKRELENRILAARGQRIDKNRGYRLLMAELFGKMIEDIRKILFR